MRSASGERYEINAGGYRAVVTEVGATLAELSHDGAPLVFGFDGSAPPVGCQGQHLLPWPNRIRDGRWEHRGEPQQLALTEPERHNAIHGLAAWVPWILLDQQPDAVTQRVTIHPQPGWPGRLTATLTHRLSDDGLTVEISARNDDTGDLPFGYAAHPYLVTDRPPADCRLSLPASHYLEVEPERLLPIGISTVNGAEADLREAPTLRGRALDTALTGLPADGWTATLTGAERAVSLWAGPGFGWAQVFTGSDDGVAVEPMTCGPDAFNPGPTHADVLTLAPGQEFAGSWGIWAAAVETQP